MAIEKSLEQQILDEKAAITIGEMSPEDVSLVEETNQTEISVEPTEDGGAEIDLNPKQDTGVSEEFGENLAENMDDDVLNQIASDLIASFRN